MKRCFIAGLVGIIGAYALADGYHPHKRAEDPQFTLLETKSGETIQRMSVSLGGDTIPVGEYDASNRTGVIAESICVHRLEGAIPLLHVEWLDYMQGMGAYQSCYFLIVPVASPTNVLARGIVPISGHWGADTGGGGDYSVIRTSNTLAIVRSEIVQDTARSAKPLYHFVEEKGWEHFASTVQTTLTRTYAIETDGLHSLQTELRYVAQRGDTLEAVCAGFKVNAGWVRNPDDIAQPGRSILVVLPEQDAERLYPTVDRRAP